MADSLAISAAGTSLRHLLDLRFGQRSPIPGVRVRAQLVRSEDFAVRTGTSTIVFPALSLFLYRVDVNQTMRAAWSGVGAVDGTAHLPLDLHFLLTAWADNPEHEHQIIGRAMQVLDTTPTLSGPMLDPAGEWLPSDSMQVVPGEMSTETLMRTFDSLSCDFKLSVCYVARIVRIDGPTETAGAPVTTAVTGLTPALT